MSPALSVTALEMRYGQKSVFKNVNLSCDRAERVAILGPSGCGKSTLLRLVVGIENPDSGVILLHGKQNSRREVVEQVSYLSQRPALLPWLSTMENVLLPIRLQRPIRPDDRVVARELLDAFGVGSAANLRPSQLSGGMRQRAALAQCLIVQGSILILDEPFSALDDITRRSIILQLDRWLREKCMALVLVTHSFEDAAYLADRVVFWHSSIGVNDGSPLSEHQLGGEWRKANSMSDFADPAFWARRETLFRAYVSETNSEGD